MAISIVAASCSKEAGSAPTSPVNENGEQSQFIAYTEGADGTKTYLENLSIKFHDGDEVSMFAGSTLAAKYQVTDSEGRTAASLTKVKNSSSFGAGTEINANVAYYPYSSGVSVEMVSGGYYVVSATLPETQSYHENSFGQDAFPMVAVTDGSDDFDLNFKNICGVVELKVKGNVTVEKITIAGNSGEPLWGSYSVKAAYGETPVATLSGDGATVILDCGSGVQLNQNNETSFMITLPPVSFQGGFTVVINASDGTSMTKSTNNEQNIVRNKILAMPSFEYIAN